MSITAIIGCMFSGKSSELFRRLNRAKIADQTVILYKYALDNRYDDDFSIASSHDGVKITGAIPVSSLRGMVTPCDIDVIGIDEGQFIEGVEDFALRAAYRGVHVIVAGLDADYRMRPFERMTNLISIAERVLKLHAVCSLCKGEAAFTKRIDTSDEAREVIGGADKYVACCRKCFNTEPSRENEQKKLKC